MARTERNSAVSWLPSEVRQAADTILNKLESGAQPLATRSQLGSTKVAKAAVQALIEAGVLASAGRKGKSEYLTLNRGAETLTFEKQRSDERRRLLEKLENTQGRFVLKSAILGTKPSTLARDAYKDLVTAGEIVEVGKWKSGIHFARTEGRSPKEALKNMAVELIYGQAIPGKLLALPAVTTKEPWNKTMPTGVRSAFTSSLKLLLDSGQAVMLEGAAKGTFVLTASLEEALTRAQSRRTPEPRAPAGPERTRALDVQRVREAYRRLATERGSLHVVIADLWQASGASLDALKTWLLDECRAGRAEPALGEPALASEAQLAAALEIEGRPHLYIQLVVP